jgi:hypothetical protein
MTGCSTTTVPIGKYDVLAESSQTILKGTTETYTRIEKLQQRFFVETASDAPLTRDTFRPVLDGQSFDLTPELRFRETALEVLVRYALVLQAFAKRDFAGEVDKATEELAGSVKALTAAAAPDNESFAKASGLLAPVVNIIGRAIVQGKRLEALKMVMDAAQPDLAKLTQLITGSNAKITRAVDTMLSRIVARRKERRPAITAANRVLFDTEVALLISEADEIKDALDQLSASLEKVPSAHAEIRKILDETPTGLEAVQQLVKEVQRIDKLYRSIQ